MLLILSANPNYNNRMDAKFVEPTYRLKPHEELKFSPPAVARISEEVVKAMLSDKKWIGEGEEAVWTVQITEQVKSKVIGERGVGKDIVVWRASASRRENKKTSHLPSTPTSPFSLSPLPSFSPEFSTLQDCCSNCDGSECKARGPCRVTLLVGRGGR